MTRIPPVGDTLSRLLGAYSNEVQATVYEARRYLLSVLPGASEVVDSKARVIGYGYGTGYRDMIFTLILSRGGVKLGVVEGATLPDPRHLMEGEGRRHRHVVLQAPSDLRRAGLKPLLRSALSAWRIRATRGA